MTDNTFVCHRTARSVVKQSCAGSLIYANNTAKLCRDPEQMEHQRRLGKSALVFSSPREFIDHHRSTGVVSGEVGT